MEFDSSSHPPASVFDLPLQQRFKNNKGSYFTSINMNKSNCKATLVHRRNSTSKSPLDTNSYLKVLLVTIITLSTLVTVSTAKLTLKPDTPTKEVFTGDSFVITCLSDSPDPDYKLQWRGPDNKPVSTTPTAPIHASEKSDGLQIIFLRHHKKHSGVYKCIQYSAGDSREVESITFTVTIFKSIELPQPSTLTAIEGETFQVECNVKFDQDVQSASVVWDKTGRNIVNEDSDKYYVSESKPPTVRSRLTIKQVDKSDAGLYTCRATQFTPTISQFKQVDIGVRVQYKPKFPPGTPNAVWIDKQEVLSGKPYVNLNITCIVDADPPAKITWYDKRQQLVNVDPRTASDPSAEVIGIVHQENMSILQYRYKVTGQETLSPEIGASGWPPQGSKGYITPPGRGSNLHPIKQPDVNYECHAKNDLGSVSQHFALRIGDLPPVPSINNHLYIENNGVKNYTLTLTQPPVEPPVDYYRLELSNGQTVEFNSSSLISRDENSNNATYLVDLKPVSKGHHKIVIYAHNPVGWSQPLRDSKLKIHVTSSAMVEVPSLLPLSILPLVITMVIGIIFDCTCCH